MFFVVDADFDVNSSSWMTIALLRTTKGHLHYWIDMVEYGTSVWMMTWYYYYYVGGGGGGDWRIEVLRY